jgi:hypothetical protein
MAPMPDNATIEVKTGFLVFAFFLFACTPRIEIDREVLPKV